MYMYVSAAPVLGEKKSLPQFHIICWEEPKPAVTLPYPPPFIHLNRGQSDGQ